MIHAQMPVDVSAFLLNEKRSEILKIESRHHVRITVIPNRHMETPHYKIERIKHDDPRLEGAAASYTLADLADTDEGFSKRQKEEVKAKQEAVVKSFTPDQPAPMYERPPAPKAEAPQEEGFFSKLWALLSGKPAEPVVAPPVKETRPAKSERSGRSRSRNRRTRDRDDRSASRNAQRDEQAAKEKPTEATSDASKPARQPRQPKKPRKEVAPAEVETKSVTDDIAATEETVLAAQVDGAETTAETGAGTETTRRRRRRGGRNRNRRDRDTSAQDAGAEETQTEAAEDPSVEASAVSADVDAAGQETVVPTAPVVEPTVAQAESHVEEPPVSRNETAVSANGSEPFTEAPITVTAEVVTPVEVVAAVEIQEPPQKEAVVSELIVEVPAIAATETADEALAETAAEAPVESFTETPAETGDAMLIQDLAVASFGENPPQPVASLTMKAVEPASETTANTVEAVSTSEQATSPQQPADAMETMLSSAGLTLAATDPEKLKAAQEAAQSTEEMPKLGRPRKPVQSHFVRTARSGRYAS